MSELWLQRAVGIYPHKENVMKYRKKPVVIEARQFTTNNEADNENMERLCDWMNARMPNATMKAWHDNTSIFIPTLEGQMRADVGDWIIQGVKGEFYPCKPDIFTATYESVD